MRIHRYKLNPLAEEIGQTLLDKLDGNYSDNALDFLRKFTDHWEKLDYDMSKYREALERYGKGRPVR